MLASCWFVKKRSGWRKSKVEISKICQYSVRVRFVSFWPYRLMVRTRPSQGWNRGSTPRRVTRRDSSDVLVEDSLKTQASFGVPLTNSV